MKSIITINLIFCLLTTESLMSADGPDIPTIDARTANSGRKTIKSGGGTSSRQEQDVRSLGVSVDLRSSNPPKQPYDVQCFFLALSTSDKQKYIYDVQCKKSSMQKDTLQFQAPNIQGASRQWTVVPVSGTFTGTAPNGAQVKGNVSGNIVNSSKTSGSKFYGWLVRVVSQGKVVRIESNQAPLKAIAEKNPEVFDKALKIP